MSGIYHVSCPDGVEPDEHVKNLRRAFENAREGDTEIEVDLIENYKGRSCPMRLIMARVRETGESTTYDGFMAKGYGIVYSDRDDIDPRRNAQPMECYFNFMTSKVRVETLKKVGF